MILAAPPGLSFVDVAGGMLARRSDGRLIGIPQAWLPEAQRERSCTAIAARAGLGAALSGPPSTYTTFAVGCASSRPPARLVPLDTPKIGAWLPLALGPLPANAAFLLTGLDNAMSSLGALPLALGNRGMPGCSAHVADDAVTLLFGLQTAQHALWIPDSSLLLGQRFYQQALVLDPLSGNALGAVMSDASAAVIGR